MMVERPTFTKPDGNQAQIVKELRDLGFVVDIICNLPGLYDIVVSGRLNVRGCPGPIPCAVRVEIKMPGKKLNDNEEKYHANDLSPGNLLTADNTQDIVDWFGYRGNNR